MELYEHTAHELHDLLQSQQISSRQLVESVLERIKSVEDTVQAYVTVTGELALAQADQVDRQRAMGNGGG